MKPLAVWYMTHFSVHVDVLEGSWIVGKMPGMVELNGLGVFAGKGSFL